ncbi:MAG: hypothetical protein IJX36_00825 [Thermoguttaceae bacterium]|nr:hypothetical protein [Thermoguttaceae bacterium]MBQ8362453.1 hypothetical protein [Thermoguttaceae bacterium]
MNLFFDEALANDYSNGSQKTRVMSEPWAARELFCPCCGNDRLTKFPNGKPVAVFFCSRCNEIFELKSKKGKFGRKISGGAYDATIKRITSAENPHLLALEYRVSGTRFEVCGLTLIPKFFFTPSVVERRPPLPSTARRAGWVGSNILLREIPESVRISVVRERSALDKLEVVAAYRRCERLQTKNLESRGWLLDALACVEKIPTDVFRLSDVYAFVDELKQKYPENNNVEAKIRQQLQLLRNRGFLEFLQRGVYRKSS